MLNFDIKICNKFVLTYSKNYRISSEPLSETSKRNWRDSFWASRWSLVKHGDINQQVSVCIMCTGAAPFSELRSTDVRGQLKRGYRMSCPPDCPPELWVFPQQRVLVLIRNVVSYVKVMSRYRRRFSFCSYCMCASEGFGDTRCVGNHNCIVLRIYKALKCEVPNTIHLSALLSFLFCFCTVPLQRLWHDSVTLISTLLLTYLLTSTKFP